MSNLVKIGKNVKIGLNNKFCPGTIIKDNVVIGNNNIIFNNNIIESGTIIGNNNFFHDNNKINKSNIGNNNIFLKNNIIKENSNINNNINILGNCIIGENSILLNNSKLNRTNLLANSILGEFASVGLIEKSNDKYYFPFFINNKYLGYEFSQKHMSIILNMKKEFDEYNFVNTNNYINSIDNKYIHIIQKFCKYM